MSHRATLGWGDPAKLSAQNIAHFLSGCYLNLLSILGENIFYSRRYRPLTEWLVCQLVKYPKMKQSGQRKKGYKERDSTGCGQHRHLFIRPMCCRNRWILQDRRAPGSLVGLIICLLYADSRQVSSPVSQSPAAPCIHHPLKGDEQLQASRKTADSLVFVLSFHCAHPLGPPSTQLTREPRLSQMEMQLTLLLSFLPFCHSIQEPLKLHILTQTGKMPSTAMLQFASTGSKVQ